jgi:hypothetical protein
MGAINAKPANLPGRLRNEKGALRRLFSLLRDLRR